MIFKDKEMIKPFVKGYFQENILKHIRHNKEVVFFPPDCSKQMAELVRDHIEEKYHFNVRLSKNRKGVFKLIISYENTSSVEKEPK